ncbi:hypothetical protein Efla_004872 [Eimeria flavescens]
MLSNSGRTGFLPILHSEGGGDKPPSFSGRRTRQTRAQSQSFNSSSSPATPPRSSSTTPSAVVLNRRGRRRWSRWGRGLARRLAGLLSTYRSSALILLLGICILTQIFIFLQVTRHAHAYLASRSPAKSEWLADIPTPGEFEFCLSWQQDAATVRVLVDEYDSQRKALPYVGNENNEEAMHGKVGVKRDGIPLWTPAAMPDPIDSPSVNKTEELKSGGGFYLKLSDALPLDRHPPDNRDPICLKVKYDLQELSDSLDTSIVITFFNEPMSTLLRTLHSVLNFTPPPLVREILLVDDASNNTALLPGNDLDEYLPHLPKVKLLRMKERSGIVPARMKGIRAAQAPVIVILDSHIEVNDGWLEPQLARIHESPKSFVFPQTLSVISTNFEHSKDTGIGCFVSFDWNVQEKSQVAGFWGSPNAIASPMHGGGLIAFRKDTIMEIGGYDEGFTMWGAENVEFSFRIWMCGGRLECTPCAAVYHIFRSGGTGYQLPPGSVWKNRMRTARLWMGDYFPLAAAFNSHHLSHPEPDLPDMTEASCMENLKKRLNCKDMNWFMKNVDPKHEFQDLDSALAGVGDIRSVYKPSLCLDALGETDVGNTIGFYQCHGQLGNQAFLLIRETKQLRLMGIGKTSRARLCLKPPGVLERCTKQNEVGHMEFNSEEGTIRWTGPGKYKDHCLGLEEAGEAGKLELTWRPCVSGDSRQRWTWPPFPSDMYLPKQMQEGYEEYKALEAWRDAATELRSKKESNFCVDSLQQRHDGSPISVFWCHGGLGTQGFSFIEEKGLLLAHARGSDGASRLCVGPPANLYLCTDAAKSKGVFITAEGQVRWRQKQMQNPPSSPSSSSSSSSSSQGEEDLCLTIVSSPSTPVSKRTVEFQPCRPHDLAQLWQRNKPPSSSESRR